VHLSTWIDNNFTGAKMARYAEAAVFFECDEDTLYSWVTSYRMPRPASQLVLVEKSNGAISMHMMNKSYVDKKNKSKDDV
jgi:hypothetical protein